MDRSLAADMEQFYLVKMNELIQLAEERSGSASVAQRMQFVVTVLEQVEEFATRRRLFFGEFLDKLPALASPHSSEMPLLQWQMHQLKAQVEGLTSA